MAKYSVTATSLNLRSTPDMSSNFNIIARIPYNHLVELIDNTIVDWWKVRYPVPDLEGYVASKYLKAFVSPVTTITNIDRAGFDPDPKAQLSTKERMYKPLGDSSIPKRLASLTADGKKQAIRDIIEKLNVEVSTRYQPTDKHTFCNVYACDLIYFCGEYVPRVWFTQLALKKLLKGDAVDIVYGETVYEVNANGLHDWFLAWGDDFGWEPMHDFDMLQAMVNSHGGIGIICAKRRELSRSGHITVVVPETDTHKATRMKGTVIYPLQSQAGLKNYKYFSLAVKDWWNHDRYSSYVVYYHG